MDVVPALFQHPLRIGDKWREESHPFTPPFTPIIVIIVIIVIMHVQASLRTAEGTHHYGCHAAMLPCCHATGEGQSRGEMCEHGSCDILYKKCLAYQ
jgi:hypothetical protein